MIREKDWHWDGHAQHFIGGRNCEFHLATRVGDFIISTVGEYRPRGNSLPDGTGEYSEYTTIGLNRLFETFVFRASKPTGFDVDVYEEIDREDANECDDATVNHLLLCRKYAAVKS
jgi:hypothetical protein